MNPTKAVRPRGSAVRVGTALSLLILMLICNTALGSGRRPTNFGSYPATSLGDTLAGSDAKAFTAVAAAATGSRFTPGVTAWLSGPHPFLESLLPGVRFIRASVRLGEADYHWNYAWTGDRFSRMDALNSLLADAGFTFDSAGMLAAAKAAVLFALFGTGDRRADSLMTARQSRDPWAGQLALGTEDVLGFPAVTFLSLTRRRANPAKRDYGIGVSVVCRIGGQTKKIYVGFASFPGGRVQPQYLSSDDGSVRAQFGNALLPPVDSSPHRGAIRGPVDVGWTLTVTGDTWGELDDNSELHCFVVVDSNGSPTGDTVRLDLSGVPETVAVYLMFLRVQDNDTAWLPCDTVGAGAHLAWTPTYDSTAEYRVAACSVPGGPLLSNEVLLDPEAWRDTTLGGKTIVVHYMKYNDAPELNNFIPFAAASAETALAATSAAWAAEVQDWCAAASVTPADDDDTFDVYMGTTRDPSGMSQLPWYHTPWYPNAYHRPGREDQAFYMPADFEHPLVPGSYVTYLEADENICAHELWHACQEVLRAGANLGSKFRLMEEGQAAAVPSMIFHASELRTGRLHVSQYRIRACEFLSRGLSASPYWPSPESLYRFCLYWRHLYEAGGGDPAVFVKACQALTSVDTTCERSETERAITAGFQPSGHPYADFDASLAGFHRHYCLVRVPAKWDSGGPGGVYDSCIVAAETIYTYNGTAKAFEPQPVQQHTGRLYEIVNTCTAPPV